MVLDLVQTLQGSDRNNFSTSLGLVQKLSQKQMTLLSTIRKNQHEFLPELVNARDREHCPPCFHFKMTLHLFQTVLKKGKVASW